MISAILLLAGSITVSLEPQVEIVGPELTLERVATVTTDDPAIRERLANLSLGYAPSPGYSRLLRRENIESAVRTAFPDATVSIEGASAVRVMPKVETLPATRVEAEARAALERAFAGEDFNLVLTGSILDRQIPVGNSPVSLEVDLGGRAPQVGPNSVPVRVILDGETYGTVWTNWRAEVWRQVPVLKQPVAMKGQLSNALVEWQRRKLVSATNELPPTRDLIESGVARRALQAGEVLRAVDIERRLLVHNGDTVILEVRNGNVRARIPVVARQDGHLGARIRVESSENGREFNAVIIDRDLVRIELGAPSAN